MFGFDNVQFKDSISFLGSSLDRLVGLSKYKDYDEISEVVKLCGMIENT